MISFYKKKLKNKSINYIDSYIPFGYKLGDVSPYLQTDHISVDNNSINEQIDTIVVHSDSSYSTEKLHDLITSRIINQRRNYFAEENDPLINSETPPSSSSSSSSSDTTIEFIIPSSQSSKDFEILNIDKLSSGLSLLNMSINNNIFINNPENLKNFMGDSIAQIINSVTDDDTLNKTFNCLNLDKKLKILKLFLSDNEIVSNLKNSNDFQSFNFSQYPNSNEISFEQLILLFIQACYNLITLFYQTFGIPIISFIWSLLLSLNEQYNILDLLLTTAIKILSSIITLFLKLVLNCTKMLESQQDNQSYQSLNPSREAIIQILKSTVTNVSTKQSKNQQNI
jgi:hypothetical protein